MKQYKPTPLSRRMQQVADYSSLSKREPFKPLTRSWKRGIGRSHGKISSRHKGGGVKKLYREIEFGQAKMNVPAKVVSIEYDPFRTSFIALVSYRDGDWRYILAPSDLKVGKEIVCAESAPLEIGNRLMLKNIPVGSSVHNVETMPMTEGRLIRSAGSYAEVLAQDGKHTHLRMPSSEVRKVINTGYASYGRLSNVEHGIVSIGIAGRNRRKGIRPTVRGTAMNPVDHPYGGGEGRTQRGTKRPKTKWGKVTGGHKTRVKTKYSNNLIIKRRVKKKRK